MILAKSRLKTIHRTWDISHWWTLRIRGFGKQLANKWINNLGIWALFGKGKSFLIVFENKNIKILFQNQIIVQKEFLVSKQNFWDTTRCISTYGAICCRVCEVCAATVQRLRTSRVP